MVDINGESQASTKHAEVCIASGGSVFSFFRIPAEAGDSDTRERLQLSISRLPASRSIGMRASLMLILDQLQIPYREVKKDKVPLPSGDSIFLPELVSEKKANAIQIEIARVDPERPNSAKEDFIILLYRIIDEASKINLAETIVGEIGDFAKSKQPLLSCLDNILGIEKSGRYKGRTSPGMIRQ